MLNPCCKTGAERYYVACMRQMLSLLHVTNRRRVVYMGRMMELRRGVSWFLRVRPLFHRHVCVCSSSSHRAVIFDMFGVLIPSPLPKATGPSAIHDFCVFLLCPSHTTIIQSFIYVYIYNSQIRLSSVFHNYWHLTGGNMFG